MKDALDFAGKTALVTGSGRNIGRAIVLELAARGANVVVNARATAEDAAEAEAVKREAEAHGVQALVVAGDAAEPGTIARMKELTQARFGRVDICVSNANGRMRREGFFDTTDEDWHFFLNQQLTASWYLAKAFVPGMREAGWGRIIHINGPAGWTGSSRSIPLAVGKGGLHVLTKSLAAGLGEYGITVNDVNPGFVDISRGAGSSLDDVGVRDRAAAAMPIRRLIAPEEIAWACAYLCSARSGAVTGTVVDVDGGPQLPG
ncbi:SDR family NAD(P)-dependent oxidoreductase [Conexibacter sp. CPCC 206217]|uniref:SDR family NAD(P)-dependent oxidoreductase n=1 Tax=Conexibacter sp. CPCC 206217 TaxID=3064574 RepID=UPI00271AC8DF|nr:SDR family oxidoreductase [Conexibacter sp. CPCC 206217]MDO8212083.1 SDR family oxidoreductase [Conexibacter sp. CPCC 206217]